MRYNIIFLDLDGTVYIDGQIFPGLLPELIKYNEENGKMFFLTNNTSKDKKTYVQKLKSLGINFVKEENIISPIDVFIDYSKSMGLNEVYYLLPKDVISYIEQNDGPLHIEKTPQAVVVGFDTSLSYEKLAKASEFINDNIPLYATHLDKSCPTKKGPIPDCGSIILLLKQATNAEVKANFGKPSKLMCSYISKLISNSKQRCALIGDRTYTDIALGNMLGISSVIVKTGEYQGEIISEKLNVPKYEFESLKEFLSWNQKG